MATRIEIEYNRIFTDSEAAAISARATVTTDVLEQLGPAYQNLPDIAMAAYVTETNALQADMTALNALIDQIRPLLSSIDLKARLLDEKNKRALPTLRGLLRNDADISLLDQITGPQPQGPSTPPTPPSP